MSQLPNFYFVPNDLGPNFDPQVFIAMGRTEGERRLFAAEYCVSRCVLEVMIHGVLATQHDVNSVEQAGEILSNMFPNAEHYEILMDSEAQL